MDEQEKIDLPKGHRIITGGKDKLIVREDQSWFLQTEREFLTIDDEFDNMLTLTIDIKRRKAEPNHRVEILDLGSGSESKACREIERNYHGKVRATGIDLYPSASKGVSAAQGDIRDLPFKDKAFDIIFSFQALRYTDPVRYGKRIVHEISRVLKPGGVAILDWEKVEYSKFQTWVTEEGLTLKKKVTSKSSLETQEQMFAYILFKSPIDEDIEMFSKPLPLSGD